MLDQPISTVNTNSIIHKSRRDHRRQHFFYSSYGSIRRDWTQPTYSPYCRLRCVPRNGMRQEIHVRPNQQVILIDPTCQLSSFPSLFFPCLISLSLSLSPPPLPYFLTLSLFRHFRATRRIWLCVSRRETCCEIGNGYSQIALS